MEIDQLKVELNLLKSTAASKDEKIAELLFLQASHAEALAAKDRAIEELKASSASALEDKEREIEALKASSALATDTQAHEALRAELESTKKDLERTTVCL